jgi:hypothetical protein
METRITERNEEVVRSCQQQTVNGTEEASRSEKEQALVCGLHPLACPVHKQLQQLQTPHRTDRTLPRGEGGGLIGRPLSGQTQKRCINIAMPLN